MAEESAERRLSAIFAAEVVGYSRSRSTSSWAASKTSYLKLLRYSFLITLLIALATSSWGIGRSANAADVGVVLLHGNGGMPRGQLVNNLAEAFKDAGFNVTVPEMPWSRNRHFDAPLANAVLEIDAAVRAVKVGEATALVLVGHSFGASAALHYAATHGGVAGVIAVAPGVAPDTAGFRKRHGAVIEQSRRLVSAGRGGEAVEFSFFAGGRMHTRRMSASIYASYYDPDSDFVMSRNSAALQPGTALLWIVGDRDPRYAAWGSKDYAFAKAPPNRRNAFVVMEGADHFDVLEKSTKRMVDWVKELSPR